MTNLPDIEAFYVERLGKSTIKSPLELSNSMGDGVFNFINDDERVLYDSSLKSFYAHKDKNGTPILFPKAGPHE